MTFTGAFVIPTAIHSGDTYLYFGIEKNSQEASAFGGKREPKESIQKCASRELQEESLGVFAKSSEIKKKLANQKKYHVDKIDKATTCVTYIVPVSLKGNPMKQFAGKRKANGLKRCQKEMTEVIAVKASEVIRQVNINPFTLNFNGHPVRPLLSWVLNNGVKTGKIR